MGYDELESKRTKPQEGENDVVISFFDKDYLDEFDMDHDDPMMITATIHNYVVKRILVNQGSSVDILYTIATTSMNISKEHLKLHNGNLIDFSRK